jgi:signal transduction histidine kinase
MIAWGRSKLTSAIKFTPEGGRIDVGAAPKDGLIEVSVSDTGVGIAPEEQGGKIWVKSQGGRGLNLHVHHSRPSSLKNDRLIHPG